MCAVFSARKFRSFRSSLSPRKLFTLLILTTLVLVPISFLFVPRLNQPRGGGILQKPLFSTFSTPLAVTLPVLVFACDRVGISVHIEQLLKYRPKHDRKDAYPIIVSLDKCKNNNSTRDVILSFSEQNVTLIEQPDATPISNVSDVQVGYYKIARHYKFALDQIFLNFNYSAVIITEDDLKIAPDFFEYFTALYPLLVNDPTLWCISAWNENGREELILKDRPDLLHRSDFFPGLGWMLTRDLWLNELRDKWPDAFWDDWMRHPDQRKGRECIRPEISRTTTFGDVGVSGGQFFWKYHRFIHLNNQFTHFTQFDLSYLEKDRYDKDFLKQVYDPSNEFISYYDLRKMEQIPDGGGALRISYGDRFTFRAIAQYFDMVDDFKYGVMRMAYRGVISVAYKGRRLYITPVEAEQWTHYEPWE